MFAHSYDYAGDFDVDKSNTTVPRVYAELDMLGNDEPFWEPASVEEELKKQLKDFVISRDGLV